MIRISTRIAKESGRTVRPATQSDVAREAGVSQALASCVLAGKPVRVSPETEQRIHKAADRLGYRPNLIARGLRGAPTGLLGAIVRDLSAPVANEICRHLLHKAPAHGFDVLLTDAADDPRTLLRLAALMKSRLCDGVFLVGELPGQDAIWDDYLDIGLPTILLLHSGEGLFPSIATDEEVAVRAMAEHLVGLGHRRIGFVVANWMHGVHARFQAFRRALAGFGVIVEDRHVVMAPPTREGGANALSQLVAAGDLPTAVVATTDLLALGVLAEAHRQAIPVPQSLSVVGFDDIPGAADFPPGLTTMHQPVEAIAEAALSFFDRVEDPGSRLALLEAPLIVRGSTGPPRLADLPNIDMARFIGEAPHE